MMHRLKNLGWPGMTNPRVARALTEEFGRKLREAREARELLALLPILNKNKKRRSMGGLAFREPLYKVASYGISEDFSNYDIPRSFFKARVTKEGVFITGDMAMKQTLDWLIEMENSLK